MYAIVSSNAKLEIIVFGPFNTLNFAKIAKRRLEKASPAAKHLLVRFQDMKEIPR
jgi:hypothetical protein